MPISTATTMADSVSIIIVPDSVSHGLVLHVRSFTR
jgi:hypothetical protein